MAVRQGFMVEQGADREAAFATAAEEGFDFVELNMDYAFARERVDPGEVRRLADRHGLDLVAHLPYRLDACSPREHVREGGCRELEAAVDAAAEMGAETGVMHAQTVAHEERWPAAPVRAAVHEAADRLAAYGTDRDVTVCVENLKGAHYDAGDFRRLFEATDAAMCLDTGHAHATGHGGGWQADLLREYGDRIDHIHLNETRRDDEDEHLPVGLGHVDFGAIAAAIRETGWSGTCTHEVFCRGTPGAHVVTSKEEFAGLLADGG